MLNFLKMAPVAIMLAACSPSGADLGEPAEELGNFKLGHNIVVASKAVKGPLSRDATEEELKAALTEAIAQRFERYDGSRLFHFGVSVEGYVLAAPGVPVVASPKSIMIVQINVWDDAANKKLMEKPRRFTVFETLSAETAVGSGLTQSKEEQLHNLSVNAAKKIELFLVEQQEKEGWFTPDAQLPPAE